jgi:fumarate hydratase, class II
MVTEQRIARDTMGEMTIPAGALWGASTQRAVENFPVSGQPIPMEVIAAHAMLKWAAATANEESGVVTPDVAAAIRAAADEVIDRQHDEQFPVDVFQTGSGTSTNMNLNEVIANLAKLRLGEDLTSDRVHPNDHVNASQSSNDTFPTSVHLAVARTNADVLAPGAASPRRHPCARKSDEFADVVKSGRTHLMDATPVTLGQEFAGYARQIELGVERVERADDHGARARARWHGRGHGPQLSRPGSSTASSSCCASAPGCRCARPRTTSRRRAHATRSSTSPARCASVAVSLIKIANDVRWMASGPRTGLYELQLPEIQPGSSIMPGKVNPVIPESVRQVAAQVIGNDAAVAIGGLSGELELNVMIPLMARNVLESQRLLAAVSDVFVDKCLVGTTATDQGPMLVERSLMQVTALVPEIGYERSAALAKTAHKQGTTLREAALADGVDEALLDRVLDYMRMTQGGML